MCCIYKNMRDFVACAVFRDELFEQKCDGREKPIPSSGFADFSEDETDNSCSFYFGWLRNFFEINYASLI